MSANCQQPSARQSSLGAEARWLDVHGVLPFFFHPLCRPTKQKKASQIVKSIRYDDATARDRVARIYGEKQKWILRCCCEIQRKGREPRSLVLFCWGRNSCGAVVWSAYKSNDGTRADRLNFPFQIESNRIERSPDRFQFRVDSSNHSTELPRLSLSPKIVLHPATPITDLGLEGRTLRPPRKSNCHLPPCQFPSSTGSYTTEASFN